MDLTLTKAYALSLLGTPYFFGGDDPISGFDCSGLACELLRSTGVVPYNFRANAQGIFDLFEKNSASNTVGLGTLAFYGEKYNAITHVAFCLDSDSMIESGGGDSHTTSAESAIQKNAFVKIRPIKYRRDFLLTLKPCYPGNIRT